MLMRSTLAAVSVATALCACGGGGASDASETNDPALIGTWIAATDSRATGGACGLDAHGQWGQRVTLKFTAAEYSAVSEVCVSLIGGNTGVYVQNNSVTAAYLTGGVYIVGPGAASTMKAIDFKTTPVFYSAYSIVGSALRVGVGSATMDGNSPARRAYGHSDLTDMIFLRQ